MILIGSVLLVLLILAVLITNKPRLVEKAIETASEATNFAPTYFELYDNSTDMCDRLVIVQPFQWHIWAVSGTVYLLNESNKTCPLNYTPSIVVPRNNKSEGDQIFKDVCINKVFNQIVTTYTSSTLPVKIMFDIEELQQEPNRFTILDALNYLFKYYITMDPVADAVPGLINLKKLGSEKLIEQYSIPIFTDVYQNKIRKILQKNKN